MQIESPQLKFVLGSQHCSGTYDGLVVVGSENSNGTAFYSLAEKIGFDIVDTAPLYAKGLSETEIGKSAWRGAIWTKVGVDIRGPIARRDYALQAMVRSLAGSAERLRKSEFQLVWIHNPGRSDIEAINFGEFRESATKLGLKISSFGVSLHEVEVWEALLTRIQRDECREVSHIMIEPSIAQSRPDLLEMGRGRLLLVMRGLLTQGRLVRFTQSRNEGSICELIASRVVEFKLRFSPDYILCGPRTIDQLNSYRFIGGSGAP